MKTRAIMVVAALAMSAATLTACGGDGDSASSYCSKVKAAVNGDAEALSDEDSTKMFEDLADAAPEELKDDFQAVVDAADFDELDADGLTAEESMKQFEKAQDALQGVSESLERIATYTEKECDVELPE